MGHPREEGETPERGGGWRLAPRRLSDFIRERQVEILRDWERAARGLPRAQSLDRPALIDHVPDLLDQIADMADELASGTTPTLPQAVAERHAVERLEEGFDLSQVVAEFGLLRDCITRLWEREQLPAGHVADLRLLNQALDRAVSESVDRYTRARDRTLQGLDRIASAALESTSLDDLLGKLLRVLVETTPAIDTATILLREGHHLRVRAAVGLEEEVTAGFTLGIGEGFAGTIAAEGRPKFLAAASSDPLVKSAALRRKRIRALYGVPLTEGGRVVGVAHIGSITAHQFSDQDKRLLAAMANRATAAIYQHVLREGAAIRARQQEAVARLGVFALESVDLQPILQRAVEVAAETLGVELAQVLELLPDGRAFLLRAGVGWGEELVGRGTVDAGPECQVGFTLLSAEPVVVQDLPADERFRAPSPLHDHGVVSGMSVVIHAPRHHGRPYGVFGAHARARRPFTPDDVNFLQAVANVVATAVARRRAEEELRSAEKRLSLYPEQVRLLAVLADSVPVLVAYLDSALRYRFNNRCYETWFGLPREELRGQHVRDVLGEAAYGKLRPYFDVALSGRPVTFQREIAYRMGGTRFIEATYTPDFAADGSVAGFVSIVSDITEQRRADQARERLAEILELGDACLVLDRDWRVTFANANMRRNDERLYPGRRRELVGKVLWELWPHPANPDSVLWQQLQRARRDRVPVELQYLHGQTGTWWSVTAYPTREDGLAVFSREVTAQKRAEEAEQRARAEAERALAVIDALLSSSLVGVGFIDTELRYVQLNDALAQMNGAPPAAHVGRTIREMLGDRAGAVEPVLRRILETGEPAMDVELTAASPSTPGQARSFLASYFPVRTPAGVTIGIGAAVVEITERKRVEAELRVSEALLQSILKNAPSAIFIKDDRARYVVGNERLAQILGRSAAELAGLSEYDALPRQVADELHENDLEVRRRGRPVVVEERIPQADGLHTYLSVKFPVPAPGGQVFTGGIATDITERKRMDEALRESELRFRALADNIPQLAWMADETGEIFWFNQRWFDYTGTTPDEMKGWGWRKVHHPQHVECVVAKLRRHIETGEVWEDTFPLRGRDGRFRWFLSRALPIRDVCGKVIRWFGTNTDITEQRFLAEATSVLTSSLDYHETFQRLAHLAVPALADWCVVDLVEREGAITRVALVHSDPDKAEAAREYLQRYPPSWGAVAGGPKVIRTGEPELVEEVSDEALARGTRDPERLRLLHELGLRSYAFVPLVARGRTLGAMGIISADEGRRYSRHDVELLQELARRAAIAVDNARLYEEAQRAVRMREEILAVVSHDLKNPLGAIHMAAALLMRRPAGAPLLRKQVETVQRSASRMDHLIGDLLDMASIQAGRLSVQQRPEEVESLVAEVMDVHEPAAKEKGLKLVRACDLPGVRLFCDRNRVLQVFGNLVGNAIKFCRSGDVVTVSGGVAGREVRFSISDTGPGIQEEELAHVFEPYWTAKRHGKKGTGLGLYISKGIVEVHGGSLQVESRPGQGTAFSFTLPLAPDPGIA